MEGRVLPCSAKLCTIYSASHAPGFGSQSGDPKPRFEPHVSPGLSECERRNHTCVACPAGSTWSHVSAWLLEPVLALWQRASRNHTNELNGLSQASRSRSRSFCSLLLRQPNLEWVEVRVISNGSPVRSKSPRSLYGIAMSQVTQNLMLLLQAPVQPCRPLCRTLIKRPKKD